MLQGRRSLDEPGTTKKASGKKAGGSTQGSEKPKPPNQPAGKRPILASKIGASSSNQQKPSAKRSLSPPSKSTKAIAKRRTSELPSMSYKVKMDDIEDDDLPPVLKPMIDLDLPPIKKLKMEDESEAMDMDIDKTDSDEGSTKKASPIKFPQRWVGGFVFDIVVSCIVSILIQDCDYRVVFCLRSIQIN